MSRELPTGKSLASALKFLAVINFASLLQQEKTLRVLRVSWNAEAGGSLTLQDPQLGE